MKTFIIIYVAFLLMFWLMIGGFKMDDLLVALIAGFLPIYRIYM